MKCHSHMAKRWLLEIVVIRYTKHACWEEILHAPQINLILIPILYKLHAMERLGAPMFRSSFN